MVSITAALSSHLFCRFAGLWHLESGIIAARIPSSYNDETKNSAYLAAAAARLVASSASDGSIASKHCSDTDEGSAQMLRYLTALATIWTVFLLSACGGGSDDGSHDSASVSVTPPPAPSAPVITLSLSSGVPGVSITENAASTDPQNTPLTYSWMLGDGATATGASVTHIYTTEGHFSPRVTVTNQAGLTATATVSSPIVIAYLPVPNFQIYPTNQGHFLGQTFSAETSDVSTDPNGLPITLHWAFGDGATATGATALHVYASPGTYTLTLTATNSANHSSVTQDTVQVFAPAPQPAPVSDAFAPYCAGPFCGAAGAGIYSGSGIGVWRYHNSTTSQATLDIDISGVHGGQSAALVFINGTKIAASMLLPQGCSCRPPPPCRPQSFPTLQESVWG